MLKPEHSRRLQQAVFLLGIGLLFTRFIQSYGEGYDPKWSMAAVALTMALWWIFEVLPLAITALLPIVSYPLLNIMSTKKIAPVYMTSVLWLFIGGFLVAIAMQKWNLHRRIALTIIKISGSSPPRLILGFMLASSALSMWISNTATTVMMVSIGLAIINNYEEIQGETEDSKGFAALLMISIAYSCTIGGIATLVGTPPNLAFTRIFSMSFPDQPEIDFGTWILFGLPITVTLVLITWVILTKIFLRPYKVVDLSPEVIKDELKKLGPVKSEEKWVLAVFALMAFLWIFRKPLSIGNFTLPGWSLLLSHPKFVEDSTVAVFCAMLLFLIPASKPGERILDAGAVSRIPWSTIMLFGGGFALAKGIQSSGLSTWVGGHFMGLENVHPFLTIVGITGGMAFLTELTSNMASTEMLLPIMASIAKSTGVDPKSLMIPTTLAASCAFMLPAATAPNAIIFASEKVTIARMVSIGFWINLMAISVITLVCYFILPALIN